MSKEKQIKSFDIRKAFKEGKNNSSPFVRVVTQIGEFLWNTGIILGEAIADVPENRKNN